MSARSCATGNWYRRASIPNAQRRLVEAWAEIQRDELQRDWDLLQSGLPAFKIEPLRSLMPHAIHRVVRFDIVTAYTLSVTFDDGTTQQIDFRPVLHGALFGPLRDLVVFNAVSLDQEVGTLTRPNGADFDPATLHEWPRMCAELAAQAQTWAEPKYDRRAKNQMEKTRR
jgi:Protein of unknown function (DUF2442)